MVGLVSTLLILAMLVVILIKVHTRRHPQYESTHTGVNVGSAPASSDTRNNTVSLQKINSHPGGAFGSLSPSGSDDPDLIPLRSSTSSRIGMWFFWKYFLMKLFFCIKANIQGSNQYYDKNAPTDTKKVIKLKLAWKLLYGIFSKRTDSKLGWQSSYIIRLVATSMYSILASSLYPSYGVLAFAKY